VAVLLIAAYLTLSHLDRRANNKVYAPLAPTFRAQVILPAHPQVTVPGEWITPTHYQGKTVLLNFWASWCTSCRAETGQLNRLQAEYASDTFIMVGMATADDPGKAVAVAKELAHYYVIAFDAEGIIAQHFEVDSLPQTFLIDATGRIRYHIKGPLQDSHWPGLTRAILQAQALASKSQPN
jgi:DsbE subfamily thiol:disulfide oxidoreductase